MAGSVSDGGSSNIGWATSTNGGSTWTNGFLPGITKIVNPANPYDRVSDPSVAYDAKHNVWLISSLAISKGDIWEHGAPRIGLLLLPCFQLYFCHLPAQCGIRLVN
jgi:hypothetical protein